MAYLRIVLLSLFIIILDQISKFFFLQNPVFLKNGSFFELYLTMNSAIAFSLPLPQILIFVLILSILVFGGLYAYKNFKLDYWLTQVSLGLILGGALGNLIDRLRLGAVVDFIKLGPWPMFNLADSAVCVGAVMIVIWYKNISPSLKS